MKEVIMTLREALDEGYKLNNMTYQRGYVTRKPRKPEEIWVKTAGGTRKGELYILMPCFTSTRFCYRVYLSKDGGGWLRRFDGVGVRV